MTNSEAPEYPECNFPPDETATIARVLGELGYRVTWISSEIHQPLWPPPRGRNYTVKLTGPDHPDPGGGGGGEREILSPSRSRLIFRCKRSSLQPSTAPHFQQQIRVISRSSWYASQNPYSRTGMPAVCSIGSFCPSLWDWFGLTLIAYHGEGRFLRRFTRDRKR